MFLQVVDIIAMAFWALLIALRQPYINAWVRCMSYPFVQFQATIQSYQAYLVDYISWGPEVQLLEQSLNEKFNPGVTASSGNTSVVTGVTIGNDADLITIGPGTRTQNTYIYYRRNNLPLYIYRRSDNKPVYLYRRSDFGLGGYDFTVNVPASLGIAANDPALIQIIQRYKLAGKQYKIIIT